MTRESVRALFAEELGRAKEKHPELAEVAFAGFNGRRRCLGICKQQTVNRRKRVTTIELSGYIVRLPREDIIDTIRHELAHAVAGPKEGHGRLWKEAAVRLGARPHRCAREGMMREGDYKWYFVEPASREIVQRFLTRPRCTDMSRVYIKGRKQETIGKLVLMSAEQYRQTRPSDANVNSNSNSNLQKT